MRTRRVAALWFPGFPLQIVARADPRVRERPAAVTDGTTVLARNRGAAAGGVAVGMRVAEAITHAPDLLLVPFDATRVQRAWDAALDTLDALSPIVEDAGLGFALADLSGVRNERAVLRRALRSLTTLHNLTARAAVADGPFVASVAARRTSDATVIPRAASAAYLAPLPIGVLPFPERARTDLALLGVRTVGAYAALRYSDVERRFGAFGLAAFTLAIGRDDRPLFPRPRERKEMLVHSFEPPIDDLTPVLFVMKALLDAHAATLRREGLVTGGVQLTLTPDAGEPITVEQRWGEACVPGRTELEALRLTLERAVIDNATEVAEEEASLRIAAMSLALLDCAPAVGMQLSLFDAGTVRRRADIAHLLAHLHALLGPLGVIEDVPVAAFLPEEGWTSRPARAAQVGAAQAAPPDPTLALVPALPGFVRCQPPECVTLVWACDVPALLVTGERHEEVHAALGPYTAAGRWWESTAIDRAYWLLVTGDGTLHLLVEDRQRETWMRIAVAD